MLIRDGRIIPLIAFVSAVGLSAHAQPIVVMDDNTRVPRFVPRGYQHGERLRSTSFELVFSRDALAWHGQPVPGGGSLAPFFPGSPAINNNKGQIAFFSQVAGSVRNQGIFVADDAGLKPIARGCGIGGGGGDPIATCGDVCPLGGTFSGMFSGTLFAPCINDGGDVLFLSDIHGGPSIRGLFLYRHAEGDIISVAAIGQPSPMGGTISAVGPGSMNNGRRIVFLARNQGSDDTHIFLWANGLLTKSVSVGDPAPGGGTFSILAGESVGFLDGTEIPVGYVPDLNEANQISFFGIVQGGMAERGIFLSSNGTHEWYLHEGQPTPMGGTYIHFFAPILNNRAEIALLADVNLGGGVFTSAWIAGRPGQWRKALTFFDKIEGESVFVLAVSRNPINSLDDCGNLLAWYAIGPDGIEERLGVFSANGRVDIVARMGDLLPFGGQLGPLEAWPSMNLLGQISFGAFTPGAARGPSAAIHSGIGNQFGDSDNDLAVGLADFRRLEDCFKGPEECPEFFGCRVFDNDSDFDVDLSDLATWQNAFSGL